MDNGSLLWGIFAIPAAIFVVTLTAGVLIAAVFAINALVKLGIDGVVASVRRRRRRGAEEPAPAKAEAGS